VSQVTAVQTNETAPDVFRALLDAGCPQSALTMVAAHSALETAGWQGGLWNYNLGNITQGDSSGDYMILPGNTLHFVPYASLDEGAAAFYQYLSNHGLIPFATANNLTGYVNQLKAIGYAGSADYTSYQTGMQNWMTKLAGTVPAPPPFPYVPVVLVGAATLIAWGYHTGALQSFIRRRIPTLGRALPVLVRT
jgi:hypothetical protein